MRVHKLSMSVAWPQVHLDKLRPATEADVARMGGNCVICWGGLHAPGGGEGAEGGGQEQGRCTERGALRQPGQERSDPQQPQQQQGQQQGQGQPQQPSQQHVGALDIASLSPAETEAAILRECGGALRTAPAARCVGNRCMHAYERSGGMVPQRFVCLHACGHSCTRGRMAVGRMQRLRTHASTC